MSPELEHATLSALVERYGSPLLLLDCARIAQQYRRLQAALPGVRLHYAIKALPHQAVLRTLARQGAAFEAASAGEMALLEQAGIAPGDVMHTHPIKKDEDIRAALRYGCTSFVVDNPDELAKFVPYRHRVGLLLRVAVENSSARINLSYKFGCEPSAVPALLEQAGALGIAVKGLTFHVGSQITDPSFHLHALERCAALILENHATGDGHLTVLDIGGGFPAAYDPDVPEIEDFCAPLRAALARLPGYVRVLAEPGRFIAAEAVRSIATVVGKAERSGRQWYYLDDGVYGSYSGHIFDNARYPVRAVRRVDTDDGDGSVPRPATLAGPTCDSVDIVSEDARLPTLAIGDFIVAERMGAYTAATANDFNLVGRARIVPINEPGDGGRVDGDPDSDEPGGDATPVATGGPRALA